MDKTTQIIADFAASQTYDAISTEAKAAAIRHHFDGIGCAAGGFDSEPCHVVRKIAGAVNDSNGASVFGLNGKATPKRDVCQCLGCASPGLQRHLSWR